jgi:hypothetical protein
MKIQACLLTLVPAVALAFALVAILPGRAPAFEGMGGGPGRTSLPGDRRDSPQATPPAQALPPGENDRANYFVDYHASSGNKGTVSGQMVPDSPANIRDSIGRRDLGGSERSPFAGELSRFRGEMSRH